jgi:hypothetical protein
LLTEILEHYIVEVFHVVDRDVARDAIKANDILLEKLFDGRKAYICDQIASTHIVKYSTATIEKV